VNRRIWLLVSGLILAACTSTPPEQAVINGAATAIGGADKVQAANTLVIEGTGENTNLGQSTTPDALNVIKVNQSKRSIDFAGGRQRLEQTRIATSGAPNPQPQKQNLGLDGDVAYTVAANGTATRAAAPVAKDRRMELYHHPVGALRAALTQGSQVSNARKEGNDDAVDVTTAQGDKFTLLVDSGTKLPSKVVSMTSNNTNWPLGDVKLETTFANYTDVGGLKLPGRITSKTDKFTTADIQVSKNTVNGDVGDLAAPADVKSAAVPDIPQPMVTSEEIAKGVWYLAGQSHHSVLVEFSDHLVLIEAPQNEVRTGAVLAKVKELRPNKPLKYVVNTHHHFDHSGGVRRAMAEEGVTLITHAGNKAFFEEIAKRPSTIYPDTLSKAAKTPAIQTVTDKYELKDASRTVEIYHIPNLHSDTMLMVYFPAERLLIEADLYNPPAPPAANAPPPAPNAPPPVFPFARSVVDTVQKLGLRVDRIVPIHGPIVPYRNLEAAARTSTS
jgi:glyoxylase-like metal-dependent hydrolase (beta-lactamase superfamily II)